MNPALSIASLIGFTMALLSESTGAKLVGLTFGFTGLLWIWLLDTTIDEQYPGQYDGEERTHPHG